jgi:hypothetical protein
LEFGGVSEHPETLPQVLSRLEFDSGWDGCVHDKQHTPELRAQLSIAISLKRIADVLAPVFGSGVGEILLGIEENLRG